MTPVLMPKVAMAVAPTLKKRRPPRGSSLALAALVNKLFPDHTPAPPWKEQKPSPPATPPTPKAVTPTLKKPAARG